MSVYDAAVEAINVLRTYRTSDNETPAYEEASELADALDALLRAVAGRDLHIAEEYDAALGDYDEEDEEEDEEYDTAGLADA